jgi:hypothetical protein
MAISLSAARTRVARLVDDEAAAVYTTAEIDDALTTAQAEVMRLAVSSGSNVFTAEAAVTTTSAGTADLSSLRPLQIEHVALSAGGARYTIRPARYVDAPANHLATEQLLVAYVASPIFPASEGALFVWGAADYPLLDQLMCVLAASELKVKEGEQLAGLEKRKEELVGQVASTLHMPGWAVAPLAWARRRPAHLRYLMTGPETLQLVRV